MTKFILSVIVMFTFISIIGSGANAAEQNKDKVIKYSCTIITGENKQEGTFEVNVHTNTVNGHAAIINKDEIKFSPGGMSQITINRNTGNLTVDNAHSQGKGKCQQVQDEKF